MAVVSLSQPALGLARALFPANKQPGNFVTHSDRPLALETLRSTYGQGPITPIAQFFVRNNLPMPEPEILANRDLWEVEVLGCEEPGVLTLGALKTLPTTTVAAVLQCSGNGRAFFQHAPSGSPWSVGAAGCALWTGARVSDIFRRFGGPASATGYLTGTGGEVLPAGLDRASAAVERSVPLDKGLADCLLVWEMNGEPIPLVHGGPVRLLVPGYFGVNQVKWVKRLAATPGESRNKIQQSGYRIRPVGQRGNPDQPSMYRMPIKSWINGPGGDGEPIAPGRQQLYGVAFAGERGVRGVEVSVDDGRHWQPAELYGPDLGPNAWRTFKLDTVLAAGDYRVVSRATDLQGETQPRHFPANQRGYSHNGWYDHALLMTVRQGVASSTPPRERVASAAAASLTIPAPRSSEGADTVVGERLFTATTNPSCGACHRFDAAGAKGVTGPSLDELKPTAQRILAAVTEGVGIMPSYADQLSDTEMTALIAFITDNY